jgi:hypothetical protein
LATTLADGAMYRHLNGDDPEAIERLLDILHVADSFQQDDAVISQLMAMGIAALAHHRAQMVAPGLRAGPSQTRRRVAALIAALLAEQPSAEAFGRSVAFERLVATDFHRWRAGGAWVLRPLAEQEVVQINADAALYAEGARATNAVAARRAIAAARLSEASPAQFAALFGGNAPEPKLPRYSRWYSQGLFQGLHRYFEQRFQTLGDRRATAVSLAAQLYRTDHGDWPDRLDQLVPAYLAALPADPFHADGRPIGYVVLKGGLPDGGDRPLVYLDAGTAEGALDIEPMYGWHFDPQERSPRVQVRQYRDLARWTPKTRRFDKMLQEQQEAERRQRELDQSLVPDTQSSPKAVQDDPSQPDAPGNDTQKQDNPEG